jgi:site-specific recombinase XerD
MRGVYEKVKDSGDWYICYHDEDGRRHREHVGRFSAAVEAYVNKKREIREGKFISPAVDKGHTLEEVFELRLQAKRLSEQTVRAYRDEFRRFGELRKRPIGKIRMEEIDKFLNKVHRDGRSADTQANYRALLCAIFSFAVDRNYTRLNPVLKISRPRASEGRTRFLSSDEEESIRGVLREFWPEREAEFDLLLYTGMRVGEAWHLTWDRVHPERGSIDVPKQGKTGWRPLPMNSMAPSAIETLHRESQGSRFVVAGGAGKTDEGRTYEAMRYWGRGFHDIAEKAGVLNVTAHTLRHYLDLQTMPSRRRIGSVERAFVASSDRLG